MERKERLRMAYDHLRDNGVVHTQKDVAAKMRKPRSNISSAFNGDERYLTDKFLRDFCKVFKGLSETWLVDGKGSMLTTGGNVSKDFTNTSSSGNATVITGNDAVVNMGTEAKPMKLEHIVFAPLVSQYAYAGYLSGYADEEYIEGLPVVPFFADHEAKGNYVAFEVRGDSMDDGTDEGYMEGDRVLGREIFPDLWANSKLHIRKWDFIIVHTEGILIKRIIAHDVDKHLITIHSLNDMYEDKVLDLKDVRKIFNVIELQRPKRR